MDTNPVRPPDMQGAGITPNPYPAGEAVGLLKSQGSMPSAALQGLATPPVPPIPTGGYAGAISAGMPYAGLPDVVARQNQQAGAAMGQQFQQMAQIREMKVADMERKYRQQQDYLKIGQEFLKSDNEAARGFGAQVVGGALSNMGVQVPKSALEALGKRRISYDDANRAMTLLGMGTDPGTVAKMFPDMSPADLQDFARLSKDPLARKTLGLKSDDDLKRDAYDLVIKQAAAFEAQHPEMKGDAKLTQRALELHRKLNGKDYAEGDQKSQSEAFEMARKQVEQEAEAKDARLLARQSALQEMRDISAERRVQMRLDQQKGAKETEAKIKRERALDVTETFLNRFEDYITRLDKKGFLPKGPALTDSWRAKANRALSPEDVDWRGWQELQGNLIGFARSVQNEIGPRAMAAFEQANRVSSSPPSAEGLRRILTQMRDQVKAAREGSPQTPGASGSPLTPQLPPGTKMEGGDLVSQSGKYVWRNGAWQVR